MTFRNPPPTKQQRRSMSLLRSGCTTHDLAARVRAVEGTPWSTSYDEEHSRLIGMQKRGWVERSGRPAVWTVTQAGHDALAGE